MPTLTDPRVFSHSEWEDLLKTSFREIESLASQKGGEYSGDTDRLQNFRRNAEALGLDYRQIWAVYAAKHWDALMQSIQDLRSETQRPRRESLDGRVDDLLVYLLLFKAMLRENSEEPKQKKAPAKDPIGAGLDIPKFLQDLPEEQEKAESSK